MAKAYQLDVESHQEIARQIGERLSREDPGRGITLWAAIPGKTRPALLGESFQIWTLTGSTVVALQHGLIGFRPDQRFVEFMENTRHFYHQIRRKGGRAIGYARSMVSRTQRGSDRWTLQTAKVSPLVDMIDKAIRWIDTYFDSNKRAAQKEEHLVRLLIIPQYHIHAFWLEGKQTDMILLIDVPKAASGLKLRHLYSWFDFLEALSKLKVVSSPADETAVKAAPSLPRNAPRGRKRTVKL